MWPPGCSVHVCKKQHDHAVGSGSSRMTPVLYIKSQFRKKGKGVLFGWLLSSNKSCYCKYTVINNSIIIYSIPVPLSWPFINGANAIHPRSDCDDVIVWVCVLIYDAPLILWACLYVSVCRGDFPEPRWPLMQECIYIYYRPLQTRPFLLVGCFDLQPVGLGVCANRGPVETTWSCTTLFCLFSIEQQRKSKGE